MAKQGSIRDRLCSDLMLESEHIDEVLSSPANHYKTFVSNGRKIDAPKLELKYIQSWIYDFVRKETPKLPPFVTAYEPGSSIVSNAAAHCGNAHILALDIRHFFKSRAKDKVGSFFGGVHVGDTKIKLTPSDVSFLTRLSTYKGSLPMGSPCSPSIANRIMLPVDKELIDALGSGMTYTRYSDDICVSSRMYIDVSRTLELVGSILVRNGFALNEKKVRCMGRGDARRVTGVYLEPDGSLSIGSKRKRELNAKLYRFLLYGEGNTEEIRGLIHFARSVDPAYVTSVLLKYENYGSAAVRGGVMGALANGGS